MPLTYLPFRSNGSFLRRRLLNFLRFSQFKRNKNLNKTLEFIHIGKCGGTTIGENIRNSPILASSYKNIKITHIITPSFNKNTHYLIVVRNPVSRALSAFNWRYKLVVKDEVQKYRFDGEYEILSHYKTLNFLAADLYDSSGNPNRSAIKSFKKIHHLKEDISFYLDPLLDKVSPSQIYGVICQHSLDEDCARILGSVSQKRHHHNQAHPSDATMLLSPESLENLKRFLVRDYINLTKLFCLGALKCSSFTQITRDNTSWIQSSGHLEK